MVAFSSDLEVVIFLQGMVLFFFYSAFIVAVLFSDKGLHHLSVAELIKKCQQRSKNWDMVWEEFENRFGNKILSYIYYEFKRLASTKISEDVIKDMQQDVYIKLLRNDAKALREFKGKNEYSFLSYLHTISKNQVKNFVASNQYKRNILMVNATHDLDYGENKAASTDTQDELEKKIFEDFIISKIRECCHHKNIERDILVFKLFYFAGLTSKEIAKDKNIHLSPSGIETTVARIKNRLKKAMQK